MVHKQRYQDMILNPKFLANIINNLGTIYYEEKYYPNKACVTYAPVLKISSKSKKLLETLKKEYGGRITKEKVEILNWKLYSKQLAKLLSLVNPTLLLSKN